MKTVRKRAIVKSIKPQAIKLVRKYISVEDARITMGVGIISRKEEHAMYDSMTHYGEILFRLLYEHGECYNQLYEWWMEELLNSV